MPEQHFSPTPDQQQRSYTVRPTGKPTRSDYKDVLRVHFTPSTLLQHKLGAGDVCLLWKRDIENGNGSGNGHGQPFAAIAFPVTEKNIQNSIVQVSKPFQEMHGIKLGDQLFLSRAEAQIQLASTVWVAETTQLDGSNTALLGGQSQKEQHRWLCHLEELLSKAELVAAGMAFENIVLRGLKRSFTIGQIDDSPSKDLIYRFVDSSSAAIQSNVRAGGSTDGKSDRALSINREVFGGLDRQLDLLERRMKAYSEELKRYKYPAWYQSRRGGVLLYGPSGTGKSMVLEETSKAGWNRVLRIDLSSLGSRGSESGKSISKTFKDARESQPSLVLIDRLEALAGGSRDQDLPGSSNIVSSLVEEFDKSGDSAVLVLAATSNIKNLDERLRRPGAFELQIEIPIPDAKTRAEILRTIYKIQKNDENVMLDRLGDRTHGFVGADLRRLVHLAVEKAEAREESNLSASLIDGIDEGTTPDGQPSDEALLVEPTEVDYELALLEIRPSAMQEVFLETPKVRWTDIGGQHEVKKALRQAVEWPFKYSAQFSRLGLKPHKGLLLYGPPGCSKTLAAKAVATEAGLNFLAVKGAELLSMYVGESERALREVFRKARAASPSIIFFDEIDAIGASRDGGGGDAGGSGSGGVNVLTTLLNELDGIEVLRGVFVLAATNKPAVLDPALMRPGRLDKLLYVGPPDLEARVEILKIGLKVMDMGEGELGFSGGEPALEADRGLAYDLTPTPTPKTMVDWLAGSTEGYSGAELVSLCQRAGYAALEEEDEAGSATQIWRRHFQVALQETKRGITATMLWQYKAWEEKMG